MAERKRKYVPRTPRKYPLGKWFNGHIHLLRVGEDFKSNVVTMKNHLYALARKNNCKIKITTILEIQAIPLTKKGKKSA